MAKQGSSLKAVVQQAGQQDLRRQAQIDQQAKRIGAYIEFLQERGLIVEFCEWEKERNGPHTE